ncbi:class I SAM-dependent methyltransferase [Haloarchaeobius sp. DFWS5]|uniref:class I SAM-dependent methyltransferase n=1 Tax=Haloarchaeobius sp. DFWS5 TaxID=3446114 RepID=UPI003EBEBF7B
MTDEHRNAVRDGYDAIAPFYADSRSENPDEIALIDEFCDRVPDGSLVLDAGCGEGRPVSAYLARTFGVVGLDISHVQAERATGHVPDARFVQGDLASLPFPSDAFAGLTCFHAVIHVPRTDHATVYEEFARVLEPGGWLLCTTGTSEWEGSNPDWLDSGTEMRWSLYGPEREREWLEAAGFTVERSTTIADEMGDGAFEYWLAKRTP